MSTQAPPRLKPVGPPSRPPAPIPRKRRIPRIILGPAVVALVLFLAITGIKWAYGGFGHYYYVSVALPRAGQQVQTGDDVRERGVTIGKISQIQLQGDHVLMTLQIDSQYRVPASATAVVALKTLLGAKFVDLRSASFTGPYLPDRGRIRAAAVGPELEDALADGVNVLDAIRPADLATVVGNLAQGAQGEGANIARGLQANSQLAELFSSTLTPQLKSLRDFDVVFGALRTKGVDLNRLADAVNVGVPVYASPAAQRQLDAALRALTPFANNLADLLILNRADWDRMIDGGDAVLGAIAMRPEQLHSLVEGLYRYVLKLGGPPYGLNDGSAAAGFVNFIGGDDSQENRKQFCGALPPSIRNHIPMCGGA
jgi:virulence factor Mce-like protein